MVPKGFDYDSQLKQLTPATPLLTVVEAVSKAFPEVTALGIAKYQFGEKTLEDGVEAIVRADYQFFMKDNKVGVLVLISGGKAGWTVIENGSMWEIKPTDLTTVSEIKSVEEFILCLKSTNELGVVEFLKASYVFIQTALHADYHNASWWAEFPCTAKRIPRAIAVDATTRRVEFY
jgi:hypothetical protein